MQQLRRELVNPCVFLAKIIIANGQPVGHTVKRCPKPVESDNNDFGGAEPESGAGADGDWGAGDKEGDDRGDGEAAAGGWSSGGGGNW